jgi:hypothetical protein
MRTAWTATAAVMASVIVLTAVVRVPRDGPLAIVEAAAGGAVVAALASLLHQLRVHREFIRLSPTSLSVRLWFGRSRTVPRDSVARVVFMHAQIGAPASNRTTWVLFMDRDGRSLLGADLAGFPVEAVTVLAGMLNVPVDVEEQAGSGQAGSGQALRSHPGWVGWFWRHPAAMGLALALVIFLVVLVAVLVATGTNPFTD